MLVRAPRVEAEQYSSIRIEDLPKVIMGWRRRRLTEQRLVPFQAARHVAYPYDRPRALHRALLCGLILGCGVFTSASPRCFDGGDIDLLHGHHRFESSLCLSAASRKRIG